MTQLPAHGMVTLARLHAALDSVVETERLFAAVNDTTAIPTSRPPCAWRGSSAKRASCCGRCSRGRCADPPHRLRAATASERSRARSVAGHERRDRRELEAIVGRLRVGIGERLAIASAICTYV